jgi:hypothetical protein
MAAYYTVAAEETKTHAPLLTMDRPVWSRLVILRTGSYCCDAGVCMLEAQDLARAMNAGEVDWAIHGLAEYAATHGTSA